MSPKLLRITARELIRILKKEGFKEVGYEGSHCHLKHEERGVKITIPVHKGKIIGPGLLKAILKQAGIELKKS
jgi:predicted RNA binding protein YcfA (HicA-like mRNA interferase family)